MTYDLVRDGERPSRTRSTGWERRGSAPLTAEPVRPVGNPGQPNQTTRRTFSFPYPAASSLIDAHTGAQRPSGGTNIPAVRTTGR